MWMSSSTILTGLSPLPLLPVSLRGIFVFAGTGVCSVLLEDFPSESGTTGADRCLTSIICVCTVLNTSSWDSYVLCVSAMWLFFSRPLSLVDMILKLATRSFLLIATEIIHHRDTLFHLLVAVHLLRAALVSEAAAQDLLREDDMLAIHFSVFLAETFLADAALGIASEAGGASSLCVTRRGLARLLVMRVP